MFDWESVLLILIPKFGWILKDRNNYLFKVSQRLYDWDSGLNWGELESISFIPDNLGGKKCLLLSSWIITGNKRVKTLAQVNACSKYTGYGVSTTWNRRP